MRITALLLVAAVAILMMSGTVFAASDFSGGDGSMGNPYLISTPDDLQNMNSSEYFRSHFVLTNDISFEGWDGEWEPIGYVPEWGFDDDDFSYAYKFERASFAGTFDGRGYTISDLEISGDENVGIFGLTRNATFFNLKLENITVTGNGDFTGLLVSRTVGADNLFAMNISVENCTVESDGRYVGVFGGISNADFVNIYLNNLTASGSGYVGGLAGGDFDHAYNVSFSNCTIEDSYISGTGEYIGGFIGSAFSVDMVNSAAKNNHIAATHSYYVGGLIGSAEYADILKCTVEIIPENPGEGISGGDYVGGFAGYLSSANINLGYTDCDIEASGNAGGFVGQLGEEYTIITESVSKGDIRSANDAAGGFIGSILSVDSVGI